MASPVATRQNLIRDLTELLKTRGLRHAAHSGLTDANGVTISDAFKVYTHVSGNLAAPAGSIYRIVIDMTAAKVTAGEETMFGSHAPHVPDPTRQ